MGGGTLCTCSTSCRSSACCVRCCDWRGGGRGGDAGVGGGTLLFNFGVHIITPTAFVGAGSVKITLKMH